VQSVSQQSQLTQFSKSPQLQLLQLQSLLQQSHLSYSLSDIIRNPLNPNPLISFNVRQIKYFRVNFPVFGVTLLIIRYLLLVVQSAALDVQLSAEDTLLPYP
tara:strand:+ start:249 stop:554 length:306 start_codon:yes stop_codon:yes gene_type:complete